MTFNTRKLLLSTCRVLKSPSSFFWVTVFFSLIITKIRLFWEFVRKTILNAGLPLQNVRFGWNVKVWCPASYIAVSAVSLLVQVKQWARAGNCVTVMFPTNCQSPCPALYPNQIACHSFGGRRGMLSSLKFCKKIMKSNISPSSFT